MTDGRTSIPTGCWDSGKGFCRGSAPARAYNSTCSAVQAGLPAKPMRRISASRRSPREGGANSWPDALDVQNAYDHLDESFIGKNSEPARVSLSGDAPGLSRIHLVALIRKSTYQGHFASQMGY